MRERSSSFKTLLWEYNRNRMQPGAKPAPDSPFGRFQSFMTKLVQVPKAELDRKLAQEQKRKDKKKK